MTQAEFVDVGIGMQQVSPYHCSNCEALEAGPHDKAERLADMDPETGWYPPILNSEGETT